MSDIEHSIEFITAKLHNGEGYNFETDTYSIRQIEFLDEHIDKSRLSDSFFLSRQDNVHRKAQSEHDQQHREKTGFMEV